MPCRFKAPQKVDTKYSAYLKEKKIGGKLSADAARLLAGNLLLVLHSFGGKNLARNYLLMLQDFLGGNYLLMKHLFEWKFSADATLV